MKNLDLLLEKAGRSLDAAESLLKQGSPDFAASRTYYGYFYVAQALLESQGLRFSRHGQVLAQYGRLFAKTKILDPSFHRLLDSAFGLRQLADYQVEVEIESEIVEELIVGGRSFLQTASSYLAGLPELQSGGGDGQP
jgi:uncharacterized protein (UPF0332 family)